MDRITLSGIRAYGRHGVNPGERDRIAPFDVSVAIELDLTPACVSDDITDTVDYAALHDRVCAIVTQTSHALLERLAGQLLDAALEDGRVSRAEVTISKPAILSGATPSVTMVRERPH